MKNAKDSIWAGQEFDHYHVGFPDLVDKEEYRALQVVLHSLVSLFAQPEVKDWLAWAEDHNEDVLWWFDRSKMKTEADALMAYSEYCIEKEIAGFGAEIALEDGSLVTFFISRSELSLGSEEGCVAPAAKFLNLLQRCCVVDFFAEGSPWVLFYKDKSKARIERMKQDANCDFLSKVFKKGIGQ